MLAAGRDAPTPDEVREVLLALVAEGRLVAQGDSNAPLYGLNAPPAPGREESEEAGRT